MFAPLMIPEEIEIADIGNKFAPYELKVKIKLKLYLILLT